MTFWPIYPERYGAKGNGVADDLAALDRAVTECQKLLAQGEGGAVHLRTGSIYGVSAPWSCIKNDRMQLFGNRARIKALSGFPVQTKNAQGKPVVHIDHSTNTTLNTVAVHDLIVDINGQSAYGIGNTGQADATDVIFKRNSLLRNIEVMNNQPGYHLFYIRNPENVFRLENPMVDGTKGTWRSSQADPTAAIYIEDRGTGANHGNIYVAHPQIATNDADTPYGVGIWINGTAKINRVYVQGGGQLFNWKTTSGSHDCTAIYLNITSNEAETHANRTYHFSNFSMEDWFKSFNVQHANNANTEMDNIIIDGVSMEYKDGASEPANPKLITIGSSTGPRISARISNCLFQTSIANSTAIHCDSDWEVHVHNCDYMLKNPGTGSWGANDSLKFTGNALDNDPITFHLGEVHEFGGPTAQYSDPNNKANRYLPIYGSAAIGQSVEADQQTKAKKRYALRQLVVKPDVNSLAFSLPVSFRVNGASKLTATVPAGSKTEVAATITSGSYTEIEPNDLINFLLAFNTGEVSGLVRFAAIRAICEELGGDAV